MREIFKVEISSVYTISLVEVPPSRRTIGVKSGKDDLFYNLQFPWMYFLGTSNKDLVKYRFYNARCLFALEPVHGFGSNVFRPPLPNFGPYGNMCNSANSLYDEDCSFIRYPSHDDVVNAICDDFWNSWHTINSAYDDWDVGIQQRLGIRGRDFFEKWKNLDWVQTQNLFRKLEFNSLGKMLPEWWRDNRSRIRPINWENLNVPNSFKRRSRILDRIDPLGSETAI